MKLLSKLAEPAQWKEFLAFKISGGHLTRQDEQALTAFVEGQGYLETAQSLADGGTFAPPRKNAISKLHSEKKRIVYTYAPAENNVLKLLTHLLHRQYDLCGIRTEKLKKRENRLRRLNFLLQRPEALVIMGQVTLIEEETNDSLLC